MQVTVGSGALKSHQVQTLLCLLLAVGSWASHFASLSLNVFICKMGMPTGLTVSKKRKTAQTDRDPEAHAPTRLPVPPLPQ